MSLLDTFLGRRKKSIQYNRAQHRERDRRQYSGESAVTTEKQSAEEEPDKELLPKEEPVAATPEDQNTQEEKFEVSMKNERAQLKEEIEKLSKQSDALLAAVEENRNVIAQKVHQENVKAFRNIQAILEDLDAKMAKSDRQEKQMDSLKNYIKCTTWFSIINLFVLVIYILYTMGVF